MNEQNRPQNLSDKNLAEAISALVDNEASELELQRILKASAQNPGVKATWLSYQRVGRALRGEALLNTQTPMPLPDFAARVSAAIAAEQPTKTVSVSHKGWWYQLGRVALVASVAGGMVFSVQQFNTATHTGAEIASAGLTAPTITAPAVSLPSGINTTLNTRTVAVQTGYETRPQESRRVTFQPATTTEAVSDDEITAYVNQMIQAHSDNAAMNSGQGVIPYTRVIITDEE
jgi:sigma-E factor negative regulatory protein RseA